jgi:RNA-directed DNA polymerase
MSDIVNNFLHLSNFQLAYQKVAENQGCAGVDDQTIANFSQNLQVNLSRLRDAVANSTYTPSPYRQFLIPKKQDSWRELRVPTVKDRIVQQALLNVLYPIVEEEFLPCSFAYRPNISYITAVKKVAQWRDRGYCFVLDADIEQYFDNIDHQKLLREVRKYLDNPGILCLIKAWISAGVSTEEGLVLPEKGIPQGAVISPMLANIYLHEFDRAISTSDLKLVRYADDFLVLSRTQERIIQAYAEVSRLLNSMGLALHSQKTQITNFERGFRFLGHGFLENAIFPLENAKEKVNVKTIDRAINLGNKKKFYSRTRQQTKKRIR